MNTRLLLFWLTFLTIAHTYGMKSSKTKVLKPISRKPKIKRLIDPKFKRLLQRAQGAQKVIAVIEICSIFGYCEGEAHNTIALRLANSGLEQLPKPFDYPNLEELDISYNAFTIFPKNITNSTLLQRLFLQDNFITTIPHSIGFLELLTVLDISKNNIKKLPEELGMLTCLRYLDVAHNRLSTLPDALLELKKLQYLNIMANRIPADQYTEFHDKLPETVIEY